MTKITFEGIEHDAAGPTGSMGCFSETWRQSPAKPLLPLSGSNKGPGGRGEPNTANIVPFPDRQSQRGNYRSLLVDDTISILCDALRAGDLWTERFDIDVDQLITRIYAAMERCAGPTA